MPFTRVQRSSSMASTTITKTDWHYAHPSNHGTASLNMCSVQSFNLFAPINFPLYSSTSQCASQCQYQMPTTHIHTHTLTKKLPARNPNIRSGPHFYLTRLSVVWYLRGENFAKYLNKLTVCDRWMMQWAIKLIMFMRAPAKCTLLHQSRPDAVHFISISYIILICNQIRTRPNSIRQI